MKRLILTLLIAFATVFALRAQEPQLPDPMPTSDLRDSLTAPISATASLPVVEPLPKPVLYADLQDSITLANPEAPARPRQRFLPMKRRIDREINKIKFAYAGEIALGLTVSYGTLSSDDTDFLLILDNLNLEGSVFTINPSVGYFFKDNMSAGVRFGYTNINGSLNTANINLGEQNGVNLAFNNIHLQSSSLSIGLYFRSYAGLDSKGHFGLFGEVDLSMKTGTSEFSYETSGNLKTNHSENLQLSLGFNPGLAVYIFPNVCSTVSFGLGGIEYSKIKQKDEAGNVIGSRTASKMRFRLNLLNIRIGVTVHLWNKKANKA